MGNSSSLALYLTALLCAGQVAAQPAAVPTRMLSVLTYNIAGMPRMVATDRTDALERMTARLKAMRRRGEQPQVVVFQEAFTAAAKAVGHNAGYRYIVDGSSLIDRSATGMTDADRRFVRAGRWFRGENQGKLVGSGLQIVSDYPVVAVRRTAFPDFACAGWDCLANKGVLMADIVLPGGPIVTVVTVHLNSRAASGAPHARSLYAYRRQLDILRDFIMRERDDAAPLILAGDLNVGRTEPRRAALATGLKTLWRSAPASGTGALAHCLARRRADAVARDDAVDSLRRGKDWQFAIGGSSAAITPEEVAVPFGRDKGGAMLSDHVGYTIHYRIAPRSWPVGGGRQLASLDPATTTRR